MAEQSLLARVHRVLEAGLALQPDSDLGKDILAFYADPSKPVYIALGQNYWEKRATDIEAIRALKARLKGGGLTPAKYKIAIYKAHPKTIVTGMGGFNYPTGFKPELHRVVQVSKVNGGLRELPLEDFNAMR